MGWIEGIRKEPLAWLMDQAEPSVTYLAMTRLIGMDPQSHDGIELRQRVLESQPVRTILDAQYPDGYWIAPGIGYSPKYKASVWQLIFLAQLGAPASKAVERAVEWLFRDNQRPDGHFVASRSPHEDVLCLNGNLVRALVELGFGSDTRTGRAIEWLAERASRAGYACRWNADLPCAWGAAKTLGALASVPPALRPACAEPAIRSATELLLSRDIVEGDYPTRGTPSDLWHKPGFPLGYHSDAIEVATLLAEIGLAAHPQVVRVRDWVLGLQSEDGTWKQRHALAKSWAGFGSQGAPNPWVTIRALRLVKLAESVGGA
jgi:hypothetical protein